MPDDTKRADPLDEDFVKIGGPSPVDLVTELRKKTQQQLVLLIELHRSLIFKMLEKQRGDYSVSMDVIEYMFEKYGCSDEELKEARRKAGA